MHLEGWQRVVCTCAGEIAALWRKRHQPDRPTARVMIGPLVAAYFCGSVGAAFGAFTPAASGLRCLRFSLKRDEEPIPRTNCGSCAMSH